MRTETVWQTVGPFFHKALPWKDGGILAKPDAQGERITLVISALDGAGEEVSDGMVEIWQADASGAFNHPEGHPDSEPDPNFLNFGRVPANEDGDFVFETVIPGRVPGPGNTLQAPHIDVSFFARGLVRRLVTRIYFEGNEHNDMDPVLGLVEPDRRSALIAKPSPDVPGEWRLTIRLQGEDESVFFSV